MSVAEEIERLFQQRGHSEYGGEQVTQIEHALQCATLAENADESDSMVVAALLHDVGHLLHTLPDDAPEKGVDDRHEISGYKYLCNHFSADVTEPVRLHVASKRFLCTTNAEYMKTLSEPSVVSLRLQGGLMSADEVAEFKNNPFYSAALRLRQWDDQAKVVGLDTPPFTHFMDRVRAAVVRDDG